MNKPRGCKVPYMSRSAIREIAEAFVNVFDLQPTGNINWELQLERICRLMQVVYDIVPDGNLPPKVEAQYYPNDRLLEISSSVYASLCDGQGRARYTLLHEFGHIVLHDATPLQRRMEYQTKWHKREEDSEWQADYFAAEVLMPLATALSCSTAKELIKITGASKQAAENRMREVNMYLRK